MIGSGLVLAKVSSLFVVIFVTLFVTPPVWAQVSRSTPDITIARKGGDVHLTFTARLQSAETMAAPWTDVPGATSPLAISPETRARFFRAVEKANPGSTNQMKIKIGSNTFIATLEDNDTATAFKALLPITSNMSELNGNEKYSSLPANLPTNASNPGTIQTGDLMLYGSNTLVLFYKTFRTSYSYTRLGRIKDPTGLAAAVGSGSVTVTYQVD